MIRVIFRLLAYSKAYWQRDDISSIDESMCVLYLRHEVEDLFKNISSQTVSSSTQRIYVLPEVFQLFIIGFKLVEGNLNCLKPVACQRQVLQSPGPLLQPPLIFPWNWLLICPNRPWIPVWCCNCCARQPHSKIWCVWQSSVSVYPRLVNKVKNPDVHFVGVHFSFVLQICEQGMVDICYASPDIAPQYVGYECSSLLKHSPGLILGRHP